MLFRCADGISLCRPYSIIRIAATYLLWNAPRRRRKSSLAHWKCQIKSSEKAWGRVSPLLRWSSLLCKGVSIRLYLSPRSSFTFRNSWWRLARRRPCNRRATLRVVNIDGVLLVSRLPEAIERMVSVRGGNAMFWGTRLRFSSCNPTYIDNVNICQTSGATSVLPDHVVYLRWHKRFLQIIFRILAG